MSFVLDTEQQPEEQSTPGFSVDEAQPVNNSNQDITLNQSDAPEPQLNEKGFIEHPSIAANILTAPLKPQPKVIPTNLNVDQRLKLKQIDYDEYYASLTPEESEAQKLEDLQSNPSKTLARAVMQKPLAKFIGGFGTTAVKSQMLGLTRLGANAADLVGYDQVSVETLAQTNAAIIDMNTEVKKGVSQYGLAFDIGAETGRNLTSLLAAGYSGANLVRLLTYETAAQLVDVPAQPGSDKVQPVTLSEGLIRGVATVGIATSLDVVSKAAPYVLSGFKSKNMREILNPKTDMGKQNLERINDAILYANKHELRLSEVMVEGSGTVRDASNLADSSNIFALRELFEGSTKVGVQTLDTLQDIVTLSGKYQSKQSKLFNGTIVERQKALLDFKGEVASLNSMYKKQEGRIWNDFEASLPSTFTDMTELRTNLIKDLADEGADPTVMNVVDNIVFKRITKGNKHLNLQLDVLKRKRTKAKLTLDAWIENVGKKLGPDGHERYVKVVGAGQRKIDTFDKKIKTIKDRTKMTPKQLLHSIKLINKKIHVPGGAISIKDASEIRGLKLAKERLEEKFTYMLKDKNPKLLAAWEEGKELTRIRNSIFNRHQNEDSLILANALIDKDTAKVMNMLRDPDTGLQHLDYVNDIFGKDSEAFKSATSLYIRAKIGLIDDVTQFSTAGKTLVSKDKTDFNALSAALATITPADIRFMKQNLGPKFGADLQGLKGLVDQYSSIFKDAMAAGGKGSSTVPTYLKNNKTEVLNILVDAGTYYSRKGAEVLLAYAPRARGVGGAAYGAVQSDEEVGSAAWFADSAKAGALGYASGIVGRHFLETQMAAVNRIVLRRANPKSIMRVADKAVTNIKKMAKAIKDGKITPPKD